MPGGGGHLFRQWVRAMRGTEAYAGHDCYGFPLKHARHVVPASAAVECEEGDCDAAQQPGMESGEKAVIDKVRERSSVMLTVREARVCGEELMKSSHCRRRERNMQME